MGSTESEPEKGSHGQREKEQNGKLQGLSECENKGIQEQDSLELSEAVYVANSRPERPLDFRYEESNSQPILSEQSEVILKTPLNLCHNRQPITKVPIADNPNAFSKRQERISETRKTFYTGQYRSPYLQGIHPPPDEEKVESIVINRVAFKKDKS